MKTLIINGSPRKKGDSRYLIDQLCNRLTGEKILVNVYEEDIKACIDCRYCWTNRGCAIDDRMQEIYKLLDEVDNVILSSPIYFSELTGELLSFASRFQVFFVERVLRDDVEFKLKKKHGALIMTAGGDTRDVNRPIVTANTIFRHINVESVGVIRSMLTNDIPASDDKGALEEVEKVALELNGLYVDNLRKRS